MDIIQEFQFEMRKKVFGPIQIRNSLPHILKNSQPLENERSYYHLLLSRVISSEEACQYSWIIDVGCRNGSYLKALADFFPNSKILGVEVDGYRRYWNFYRRMDFAQAYAEELIKENKRDIRLFMDDFKKLNTLPPALFDCLSSCSTISNKILFTFFYPFVSENPCYQWGLPKRFVNYAELLAHAKNLVSQNIFGENQFQVLKNNETDHDEQTVKNYSILSAHQGEWEAAVAREIYKRYCYGESSLTQEAVISAEEFKKIWPSPYPTHLFKIECSI